MTTKTTETTTYTTYGSVRGACGHHHRSIGAATRCAAKDQRDCKRVGGYSDRYVRRTDGEELDDAEFGEIEYWETLPR